MNRNELIKELRNVTAMDDGYACISRAETIEDKIERLEFRVSHLVNSLRLISEYLEQL